MHPIIMLATLIVSLSAPTPGATSQMPALAVVIHFAPPASNEAALGAADVALRAPEEIGEPLHALRMHPSARLAFAVSPAYISALERAANGDSALPALVHNGPAPQGGDARALLAILKRHRPLDAALARTRAGSRYLTLATAAANDLDGNASVAFSQSEFADFAADDAAVTLASSGSGPVGSTQASAIDALTRADRALVDELRRDVRAGTVELIAMPDGNPVLPLLADAGGKNDADPNIVNVGARADVQWLVRDAVRSVSAAASGQRDCGFYSPFGAYDDATGEIIQNSGAAYGLFSDRVLRGAGGQGTQAGLAKAQGAALHAYALTISRGVMLPTLFWNESASDEIGAAVGSSTAAGDRITEAVRDASANAGDGNPHVLVVRLDTQGTWVQRPDARLAVDRLVAATGAAHATTPGTFVRAHAVSAAAYGFPPNAESGSLELWMGSRNQALLWRALADARKAAGGDSALNKPDLRNLLFDAESGDWFSVLSASLPTARIAAKVDAFRSIITAIYRAAGAPPPPKIAPVKLEAPAPQPTATAAAVATPVPPRPR